VKNMHKSHAKTLMGPHKKRQPEGATSEKTHIKTCNKTCTMHVKPLTRRHKTATGRSTNTSKLANATSKGRRPRENDGRIEHNRKQHLNT
jgi:hypothetical protein